MGGTLIVYEMPPPWSALEPPMPAYDPFNDEDDDMSRGSSIDSDYISDGDGDGVLMDEHNTLDAQSFGDNTARSSSRAEYEVSILPHPDFGLGLRLESPAMEGMPAITGSFKKRKLHVHIMCLEQLCMRCVRFVCLIHPISSPLLNKPTPQIHYREDASPQRD